MLLTSIFINSSGVIDIFSLPEMVLGNIKSFQKNHPLLPHRLFGQSEILSFLEEKFSQEVKVAFLNLKPYAYKADLARYCLMYEYGGIYADLSYFFLKPLPIDPLRIVVFRDFTWSSPWDTSNGVFSAPPKHKAFEVAIELICNNVRRGYYGPTSLCPTGPALFGKALATVCEAQDLVTGSAGLVQKKTVSRVAPKVELPSGNKSHCLMLAGEIVAVKRKRMGSPGLTDFGISNGNGYLELWRKRDIYNVAIGDFPEMRGDGILIDEVSEESSIANIPEWFETMPETSPGLVRRLLNIFAR
jgi:hypothetical protein